MHIIFKHDQKLFSASTYASVWHGAWTYATYAWRTTNVYQRMLAYTSVHKRMSANFWYAGIREYDTL